MYVNFVYTFKYIMFRCTNMPKINFVGHLVNPRAMFWSVNAFLVIDINDSLGKLNFKKPSLIIFKF